MKGKNDPDYSDWSDVITSWIHFSRSVFGSVLRWAILAFVVYWVYTAWSMCGDVALDNHSRAITQRDEWCTTDRVTKEERTRRLAQHDCIAAHHAIQEGPFRLTVECFVGEHLEYFGRCSEFRVCRGLIDWAETLRSIAWYAAIIILLITARSMFESVVANGAKLKEAIASTARHTHSPLPMTSTSTLPSVIVTPTDSPFPRFTPKDTTTLARRVSRDIYDEDPYDA